tara:strand:- start:338 stop:2050 length:1713 start_codon:yes stop_codon:yes gene_type:complete
MIYTISYQRASTHFIDIELAVETKGNHQIQFQLPAWRPGRYELGNFAKNIQKWQAFDEEGNELPSKKLTKDLWEVDCEKTEKVIVNYNYYAFELNAGSTFLDENQLYVNPVNCLLYVSSRMNESCFLNLNIPEDYQVAISLPKEEKNSFKAKNFDQLADSPFIASNSLQHKSYSIAERTFHLWFQGECKPNWEMLLKDFEAFSKEQIQLFGDFPTQEYHFLFQIHTHSAYHGVEHEDCTVISLGPSYSLFDWKGRYEDLLGVSSHELFHMWNVKRIRPVEMWPYDFSQENYSRLGYLAEGATTWYGDLMLFRSGVFKEDAFLRTFNQLLNRHFNNPGVANLSVADSSFDTWLDGYSLGIPNRKSSIYTEGALITFMLDIEVRKATENRKSFDDVLRSFYHNFYQKGKGISEQDYKQEVERIAGKNLDAFFEAYVNGTAPIDDLLKSCMQYLGYGYEKKLADEVYESTLGFKLLDGKVIMIYPNSIAEQAGLSIQDEILSINGIKLDNDLSAWCKYFESEEILLNVTSAQGVQRTIQLKASQDIYFAKYVVIAQNALSAQQQEAKQKWLTT